MPAVHARSDVDGEGRAAASTQPAAAQPEDERELDTAQRTPVSEHLGVLETALDAIEQAVFVYDREGRHLYANLFGGRVVGMSPKDLIGRTWHELPYAWGVGVVRFDAAHAWVVGTGRKLSWTVSIPLPGGVRDCEVTYVPAFVPGTSTVERVVMVVRLLEDTSGGDFEAGDGLAVSAEQEHAGAPAELSTREQEVMRLLALGHTNREIGELLHLSARTVEAHRIRVARRLGLRTRADFVRYAMRSGMLL